MKIRLASAVLAIGAAAALVAAPAAGAAESPTPQEFAHMSANWFNPATASPEEREQMRLMGLFGLSSFFSTRFIGALVAVPLMLVGFSSTR